VAFAQQLSIEGPAEEPNAIEGYRILDRLAEGGMGRLFRAFDLESGRTVALKLVRIGTAAEVAGLLREAGALKRLRHPGVVRLLADGIWWGTPWLALELLDGRTLLEEMEGWWSGQPAETRRAEQITTRARSAGTPAAPRSPSLRPEREPPIDERRLAAAGRLGEVAALVGELADTLDYVHRAGFVHRDVKPANVFLRRRPGPGRVTLLDFGLACPPNAPRQADGGPSECVGTMQYAAPEQIRGEPVDARADIYSLGCVLYELVTGLRPFEGDTAHEVGQRHLYRPAPRPSDLVWGLPRRLEELIMEMLGKHPDTRPSSARQVAERLERISSRESDEMVSTNLVCRHPL
jgi:serine/threonine protein kinase